VVGAARSGTTYLHHLMIQHPEIFLPDKKALFFFNDKECVSQIALDEYQKEFINAGTAKAIGEISPTYMYFKWIPDQIFSFLGDIRLIFLLRNPIERAYSHYLVHVSLGNEFLSFYEAIIAEEERLKTSNFRIKGRYSYIDRGYYHHQIKRFLPLFQKEKMLFIISEEFYDDPLSTFNQVCKFLGISNYEPNLKVDKFHFSIPCPLKPYLTSQFIRRRLLNVKGGWRLSRTIKSILKNYPKSSKYPPISLKAREYLERVFREDIKLTSDFLGKDISKLWF